MERQKKLKRDLVIIRDTFSNPRTSEEFVESTLRDIFSNPNPDTQSLESVLNEFCLGSRPRLELIASIIAVDHPLRGRVEEALQSLSADEANEIVSHQDLFYPPEETAPPLLIVNTENIDPLASTMWPLLDVEDKNLSRLNISVIINSHSCGKWYSSKIYCRYLLS